MKKPRKHEKHLEAESRKVSGVVTNLHLPGASLFFGKIGEDLIRGQGSSFSVLSW